MKYHRKLEFYLGQGHEYAAFNGKMFEELYVQKDITTVIAPLPYFQRTQKEFGFKVKNNIVTGAFPLGRK